MGGELKEEDDPPAPKGIAADEFDPDEDPESNDCRLLGGPENICCLSCPRAVRALPDPLGGTSAGNGAAGVEKGAGAEEGGADGDWLGAPNPLKGVPLAGAPKPLEFCEGTAFEVGGAN